MKYPTNFRAVNHGLISGFAFGCLLTNSAFAQVSTDWSQMQRGVAIAVDREDNVYTLDYEQQLGAEMVLTKHDADGNFVWSTSFDQTDFTKWERAQWLATDSQGDVIVCGTLMSGFSNPVVAASIAMKFDSSGNFLWRHVAAGGFDGSSTVRCLVDRDDNAYVLGIGQSGTGLRSKIEKFAPNGTSLWSWFDAAGIGAPIELKLTPDDHLLVAGKGTNTVGFAKVDLDGALVWQRAGDQSITQGAAAGDVFGNTYISHGEFGFGANGCVVRKLDPSGAQLWSNTFGCTGGFIEVGPDNRPIAAGFPTPVSAGVGMVKVDENGGLVWQNLDADGPVQSLLLHARFLLDASGDAYFAAGTLFDMAVAKVDANGTHRWTGTTPGSFSYSMVLSRASNGVFVVGGRTAHLLDAEEGSWSELEGELAGVDGAPRLFGQGRFEQGQTLTLYADHAAPGAFTVHVVGASAANLPILGGTLVPSFDLFYFATTDAQGRSTYGGTIPFVVAPGQAVWFQSWFVDMNAVQGWSATNAQRVMND
jgi:hypothetical protein